MKCPVCGSERDDNKNTCAMCGYEFIKKPEIDTNLNEQDRDKNHKKTNEKLEVKHGNKLKLDFSFEEAARADKKIRLEKESAEKERNERIRQFLPILGALGILVLAIIFWPATIVILIIIGCIKAKG